MTLLISELTSYFESASFETPIKYSIKSSTVYFSQDTKMFFYKLQKQIAYLKDSWFIPSMSE